MGQTCCNIDNKLDFVICQQDYESCQIPQGLDPDKKIMMEQNNIRIWKQKQDNKYFGGNWMNGLAQGNGYLFYLDKLWFEGTFVRGMLNGNGVLILKKKYKYEGEFIQGKAHGRGKIKIQQQGMEFEGNWFNSRPTSGIITFLNKQIEVQNIQIHDFDTNKAVINFKNTTKYKGQINQNLIPDGQGLITYHPASSMDCYEGQWENGLFHGNGKSKWKDGSSYEGTYSYGKKQGEGKFLFPSQRYYEGHWLQGKKNGRGRLLDENGNILKQGIWQKGVFVMELSEQQMTDTKQETN